MLEVRLLMVSSTELDCLLGVTLLSSPIKFALDPNKLVFQGFTQVLEA